MWRKTTVADRVAFVDKVHADLQHRQLLGIERFGDTFQGDPLQHAWEELLDGLYYIWVEMRRNSELRK